MSFVKHVTNKPWEHKGIIGPLKPVGAFPVAPEKVALSFFIMVVGVVFSLFTVAYIMRMELADWTPWLIPHNCGLTPDYWSLAVSCFNGVATFSSVVKPAT